MPSHAVKKTTTLLKKSTAATTDDMLRHLAFDKAAQANIISTVSTGKIIMANSAACKLLGYSKKELLTKSRAVIFDIKDSNFKEMLKQRTAEGHSIALVTVIKKTGKLLPCEITSAVFMDENSIETSITSIINMSQTILEQKNIDSKKEKIVADDIALVQSRQKLIDTKKEKIIADDIALVQSRQKLIDTKKEKIVADNIILAQAKSDSRLEENNDWIKYIAKASYDVMWDWDIITGEIYVGDSMQEVFGHKVKNNSADFNDFKRCLLPGEKNAVEKKLLKTLASRSKGWNDSYMFKRHDGSIASTTSRASIVRNEEGKAIRMIGATQDVSRLLELEKKLEEQITIKKDHSDLFQLAAKLSYDGIWDWNLLTDELFLGEGFEELFGHDIKNTKTNKAYWEKYLHPDDAEAVEKGVQDAIASSASKWEQAYRFTRGDGTIAEVFSRASIIRDKNGKAYRMIGAVHDISRQKLLEEKLEVEIKLKEKQIEEAMEDAKDEERSNIGKELHDNINQLLTASKMYLEMAKHGGENTGMYLGRSSEYTLTAIEEIRKLTKGLTTDIIKNFGLCEAIEKIIHDTMEVNPVRISFVAGKFIETTGNDKFKLIILRIIQEQLNNILKHAKATEVIINLSQNKKSVFLTISDNGVGFDICKNQNGIGIANIKSRVVSCNGTTDFISQPGQGCILNITFPLPLVS
jgi:PAS domain S-box-containing protein